MSKPKVNCPRCGRESFGCKLRKSVIKKDYICYKCYSSENYKRYRDIGRTSTGLGKYTESKLSPLTRLKNACMRVMRGEEEVLRIKRSKFK